MDQAKPQLRSLKSQDVFERAVALHQDGRYQEAEHIYHALLNIKFGEPLVTYNLGLLYIDIGYYGMGYALLEPLTEEYPNQWDLWHALGNCEYKRENVEKALEYFRKAGEVNPDTPWVPAAIAALGILKGDHHWVELYADKALRVDPKNDLGIWHKGVALLAHQRWDVAWEYHEARLTRPDAGIENRNYSDDKKNPTPMWDGENFGSGVLVVHGEQGIGDEIMFSSCLLDLVQHCPHTFIVFEPNPRLQGLMDRSFKKHIRVHGTHKNDGSEWRDGRKVDYKIPVGSLPKFFRRSKEAFPRTSFLVADETLRAKVRSMFAGIGTKPKVGIAWQGGVMRTQVSFRSIDLDDLMPVLRQDVDWISLQYNDWVGEAVADLEDATGIRITHWPDYAAAQDIDYLAALISELDLVITVAQTAEHIAGGLGTPTWLLAPVAAPWREAGPEMPWYGSVQMIRQSAEGWAPTIEDTAHKLQFWLEQRKAA